MTNSEQQVVTILVPADVRYFRSVRLAVGGLATLVGFDVEAMEDLRIGVDELLAALVETGSADDLRLEISAEPGATLRIEGSTRSGRSEIDEDRFAFSRQILSVVADDFGFTTERGEARCWLERRLVPHAGAVGQA